MTGLSILMTGLEVGMAVPSHAIEAFVAKASSADWSGSCLLYTSDAADE